MQYCISGHYKHYLWLKSKDLFAVIQEEVLHIVKEAIWDSPVEAFTKRGVSEGIQGILKVLCA